MNNDAKSPADRSIQKRFNMPLPVLNWLRSYDRAWLRGDVVAGITLAAYLLPAGPGRCLAGQPAARGRPVRLPVRRAGLLAVLQFAAHGHHGHLRHLPARRRVARRDRRRRHHPVRRAGGGHGPAGGAASPSSPGWPGRASIVNFISESVMVGFKCGVALFLASTQLPKLFGIHGAHGNFWENSGNFLKHLDETNPTSLTMGGIAAGGARAREDLSQEQTRGAVRGGRRHRGFGLLGLEARGVKLLGDVPQGLPAIGLPAIHWADLNELLPLAFACFLLGAVETAAIGRTFAAKHGGRLDANQEFLALAASNLAAGLGRGFPVSGGMSQSLVNEGGGARTPLSGAIAAGDHSGGRPFLLAPAARVAAAGAGGGRAGGRRRPVQGLHAASISGAPTGRSTSWPWRPWSGVLSSGLLRGVLIGAIISLVQLIRRASQPHVALLGRIPGTRRFSDHERHPDNELIPGVLIFRPESSLIYFNMDHVRDTILDRVHAEATPPHARRAGPFGRRPTWTCTARTCSRNWPRSCPLPGPLPGGRGARHPCAIDCATKGWTPNSAGSTGSPRSPMRWRHFKNRPWAETSHGHMKSGSGIQVLPLLKSFHGNRCFRPLELGRAAILAPEC